MNIFTSKQMKLVVNLKKGKELSVKLERVGNLIRSTEKVIQKLKLFFALVYIVPCLLLD